MLRHTLAEQSNWAALDRKSENPRAGFSSFFVFIFVGGGGWRVKRAMPQKIHPAGVLLKDLFISPFFIDNCE